MLGSSTRRGDIGNFVDLIDADDVGRCRKGGKSSGVTCGNLYFEAPMLLSITLLSGFDLHKEIWNYVVCIIDQFDDEVYSRPLITQELRLEKWPGASVEFGENHEEQCFPSLADCIS